MLGEFLLLGLGYENGFQGIRVVAGIIDLRGQRHRRGGEVLYLFQMITQCLGLHGEFSHILQVAIGMRRDEIGDQLLVEMFFLVQEVKLLFQLDK